MLQLKDIVKDYQMGANTVHALKGVSLRFRESEFVAILGPSGCGKTTMLNIIGGLDRYTSGDLIIGGVSTAKFDDLHWDAYRNATIGFVFQSYNLIPHLSVLDNVEMALSLSGESKRARKERAVKVLERVGMGEEINKRPNQLSGGQMQRVAIARAIVNDPKIILADEPTGALDSELSVQVMEILQEISKDKLVIMVTHNDELAEKYGTRTVRFKDGQLIEDTNPYEPDTLSQNETEGGIFPEDSLPVESRTNEDVDVNDALVDKNEFINTESGDISHDNVDDKQGKKISRKAKKETFENLDGKNREVMDKLGISVQKKKRRDKDFKPTSMSIGTAFSLSLKNLFSKKRRTFLTAFAGSIGIIGLGLVLAIANGFNVYVDRMQTSMLASVPLGVYEYNIDYTVMTDMINNFAPSGGDSSFPDSDEIGFITGGSSSGLMGDMMNSLLKSVSKNDLNKDFEAYMRNMPKENYSALEVFYGTRYNMVAKALDKNGNEIYKDVSKQPSPTSAITIATNVLGDHGQQPSAWHQLVGSKEFMLSQYDLIGEGSRYPSDKTELVLCINESNKLDPDALLAFGIDVYQRDADGNIMLNEFSTPLLRTDMSAEDVIGKEIKLVHNDDYYQFNENTGFYSKLESSVYNQQKLEELYDDANDLTLKVVGVMRLKKDAQASYVGNNMCYTPELAQYVTQNSAVSKVAVFQNEMIEEFGTYADDIYGDNLPEDDSLIEGSILDFVSNALYYTGYMKSIGADTAPSYINVYPPDFGAKQAVADYINSYSKAHGNSVTYFDASEMFVHNMTVMIDLMSELLIAVASISLVVSTVMIGVITGNSVIERTREIGILRSLGARKRDIRRVFLAETSIIGLASGIIGIVLTYVLCPLVSLIINAVAGVSNLLSFNPLHALLLVVLSFALTIVSGIIPAISASRKNVVDALRTD